MSILRNEAIAVSRVISFSPFPLSNMSGLLSTAAVLFLSLFIASCAPPPEGNQSEPLTVAAAADLSPLSEPISALYHQTSGKQVRFVIGSSGMLARQIEQGAPFDVYLSANAVYVEELAKEGKILPDSVRVYALGRLGIWAKGKQIRVARELLDPEIRRIAIANPAHAPYGEAARDYLERAGIWAKLEPKIVYGENVRQAAQFAGSGNADALVSSWTTVRPLKGTLVPESEHAPIRQAGGVVAASGHRAEGRQFLEMLIGPPARALFQAHGFGLPPGPPERNAPGRTP